MTLLYVYTALSSQDPLLMKRTVDLLRSKVSDFLDSFVGLFILDGMFAGLFKSVVYFQSDKSFFF